MSFILETFESWFVHVLPLLLLIIQLLVWSWDRSQRGMVLARYRSMWNKIMLGFTGFMGFVGLVFALVVGSWLELWSPVLRTRILNVLLVWILALHQVWQGTLTIREEGIFYGGDFKKWEQIISYQWDGKAAYTLRLIVNLNRSAYWRNAHWRKGLIVLPDRKEAIDKVLAQYIPQTS